MNKSWTAAKLLFSGLLASFGFYLVLSSGPQGWAFAIGAAAIFLFAAAVPWLGHGSATPAVALASLFMAIALALASAFSKDPAETLWLGLGAGVFLLQSGLAGWRVRQRKAAVNADAPPTAPP